MILACLLGAGLTGIQLHAQTLNPIQLENQNSGTASWKLSNVALNREIEGYASETSVNAGEQISFFVNAPNDSQYTITIYRLGYYQGLGARQMAPPVTLRGFGQPVPVVATDTGMVECPWTDPYVFTVPVNWISGIYLAKLVGNQSGKERYIVFVVRNDNRRSDLMFQNSVTTSQAYNAWGGKSLYTFNSSDRIAAVKVSFNRPYDDGWGTGKLLSYELNMLVFLESKGYDVAYSTDLDTHEDATRTTPQVPLHRAFLSVGHDEYWSWEMRQNVTHALDGGINLGFFGADECSWQIRFERSPLTGAQDRTQVGYKETARNDPDASNPATYYLVTTKWALPHGNVNPIPGDPEASLVGEMYNPYQPVSGDILIGDTSNWVFANSGLKAGDRLVGLLGYEVDEIVPSSPSQTIRLAHSPFKATNGTVQYGDMTLYQASNGAWVFGAGSIYWNQGLGNFSPWGFPHTDPGAVQITSNILNKFVSQGSPRIITSPNNGASVAGAVKIVLEQPAGASWVNTYIDGRYLASTPPLSFTWNSISVTNGGHILSAEGFKSGGVEVASDAIDVNVQNGHPTPLPSPTATPAINELQLISPRSGGTVSKTVTISLQKAINVAWADFYVDNRYIAATPPLSFAWNSSTVSNGSHTISAKGFAANGTLLGSSSVTINVSN